MSISVAPLPGLLDFAAPKLEAGGGGDAFAPLIAQLLSPPPSPPVGKDLPPAGELLPATSPVATASAAIESPSPPSAAPTRAPGRFTLDAAEEPIILTPPPVAVGATLAAPPWFAASPTPPIGGQHPQRAAPPTIRTALLVTTAVPPSLAHADPRAPLPSPTLAPQDAPAPAATAEISAKKDEALTPVRPHLALRPSHVARADTMPPDVKKQRGAETAEGEPAQQRELVAATPPPRSHTPDLDQASRADQSALAQLAITPIEAAPIVVAPFDFAPADAPSNRDPGLDPEFRSSSTRPRTRDGAIDPTAAPTHPVLAPSSDRSDVAIEGDGIPAQNRGNREDLPGPGLAPQPTHYGAATAAVAPPPLIPSSGAATPSGAADHITPAAEADRPAPLPVHAATPQRVGGQATAAPPMQAHAAPVVPAMVEVRPAAAAPVTAPAILTTPGVAPAATVFASPPAAEAAVKPSVGDQRRGAAEWSRFAPQPQPGTSEPAPPAAATAARHAAPPAATGVLTPLVPPVAQPSPPPVAVLSPEQSAATRFEAAPARSAVASPDTAPRAEAPAIVAARFEPVAPLRLADAPAILPALQAFGAAIKRALAEERPFQFHDAGQAGAIAAVAPVAAPGPAMPAAGLDTADRRWPSQMIEQIERLRDAADETSTRIRLLPDALGPVDVAVRREGDAVHVHFAAREAETRQLLADAQPRLAEAADARGLKLGRTDVSAGDAQGGDRQQQRAPAQPQQSSRPAAPRASAAADATDTRIA